MHLARLTRALILNPFRLRQNRLNYASLAFILIIPLQVEASDWMPIASVNYDNRLAFNATVGAARLYDKGKYVTTGYYADMTVGQEGRLFTVGYADMGEWGLFKAGLGFMQIEQEDSHDNYAGIVLSTSFLISIKLGLFSQTSDYKDIRALLGVGVGI